MGLDNLEGLNLQGTPITDAGLATLRGFKKLKTLNVLDTKVTPRGVRAFEAARPGVLVVTDPIAPAP